MTAVIPGQPLYIASSTTPSLAPKAGPGTFLRDGNIYASQVGKLQQVEQEGITTLSVASVGRTKSSAIPEAGSIIVGVVIRISRVAATLTIQTVDGKLCDGEFQGIIRSNDVQQTNKDQVKLWNSFRPGDVVKAQVISIGDARSYYLSTARNDLGVVFAHSATGTELSPISWKEMQDSNGLTESRKVAGPAEDSS